ncbi:MAG: hypothetical protein EON90_03415 [Brevundimonas sp.]|nr:MAG: hypothetical protein EON90_03415 [Brevundimonas sp.]
MTYSASRAAWFNAVGAAVIGLAVVAVGAAQAGQDSQARTGGAIQKGRETRASTAPTASVIGSSQVAGITGGAVAGIVVARTPEQTACETGTAAACRAIEAGLTTGGAWSFVDGGITAMDDWESPVARTGTAPSSSSTPASPQAARGNHIAQATLSHRVLAACDGGDVSACRAFAASVRPSTASERTETRTYTAGR